MSVGIVVNRGWLSNARHEPSPNFDARPPWGVPILLVIHAISLPPGEFGGPDILALFTNTLNPNRHVSFPEISQLRVSAHFLIRRDGDLVQCVSCDDRAWHAGVSHWQGRSGCNDFSIGVELEGCDEQPFEAAQYQCLRELINSLCLHYPLRAMVGHSDIAPGRKTDPGPFFEWEQLANLPIVRLL